MEDTQEETDATIPQLYIHTCIYIHIHTYIRTVETEDTQEERDATIPQLMQVDLPDGFLYHGVFTYVYECMHVYVYCTHMYYIHPSSSVYMLHARMYMCMYTHMY